MHDEISQRRGSLAKLVLDYYGSKSQVGSQNLKIWGVNVNLSRTSCRIGHDGLHSWRHSSRRKGVHLKKLRLPAAVLSEHERPTFLLPRSEERRVGKECPV